MGAEEREILVVVVARVDTRRTVSSRSFLTRVLTRSRSVLAERVALSGILARAALHHRSALLLGSAVEAVAIHTVAMRKRARTVGVAVERVAQELRPLLGDRRCRLAVGMMEAPQPVMPEHLVVAVVGLVQPVAQIRALTLGTVDRPRQ